MLVSVCRAYIDFILCWFLYVVLPDSYRLVMGRPTAQMLPLLQAPSNCVTIDLHSKICIVDTKTFFRSYLFKCTHLSLATIKCFARHKRAFLALWCNVLCMWFIHKYTSSPWKKHIPRFTIVTWTYIYNIVGVIWHQSQRIKSRYSNPW